MINVLSRKVYFTPFVALLLCACSAAPVLISKSATLPSDVDLSGYWTLRSGPDALRLPRDGEQMEPIVATTRATRRKRRGQDVPVRVFLQYGENLKVTQTLYGIFISYDRSIVDEYTFGENREITVGPIEARRVSGWESESFVIETLDESRNRLIEQWRIQSSNDSASDGGQSKDALVRQVRIVENDKETFRIEQVFDRRK